MIWQNIKLSFRQMARKKLITSINLIGLGVGLGSVILMLAFIFHELSFDRYHKNSSNIYRITYGNDCSMPYIMGEKFKEALPGVTNVFRIYGLSNVSIKKNGELIKEENCITADSSLFSILDIPLLAGNAKLLLKDKADILISDKMAQKYFGDTNPIGKSLEICISGNPATYNITGIYRHFPSNSSIRADLITNIALAFSAIKNEVLSFGDGNEKSEKDIATSWNMWGFETFVLLSKNAKIASIEKRSTAIYQSNKKGENDKKISLQKFTSMYLHSDGLNKTQALLNGNFGTIKIFEGVAVLVLLIACFNYILLSTAESKQQFKEIACRKVFGASIRQIVFKTFCHSFLIVLLSLLPA